MNKKEKSIFVIGFHMIMLSLSFPVTAVEQKCVTWNGRSGYPMICRGPMKIESGIAGYVNNSRISYTDFHDVVFHFAPAMHAAGDTGTFLEPGTCSWINRAPRGSELNMDKAIIRFTFERTGKMFQNTVVMNAITNCNFNSDCRIKICATGNSSTMYNWGNTVDIIPSQ